MPGASINQVSVTYAAGCCLWRIIDRNNLQVHRWGYGSKAGTTDFSETQITSLTVQPSFIIQVYPLIVDATSNQTNALAWVRMSKGTIAFGKTDIVDATATEVTSLINGESIGTYYGQNLTGLTVQAEDGASLSNVQVIDSNGGTVITLPGTVRDAGHYYWNLAASGLSIPVTKGMSLKVTTVTA